MDCLDVTYWTELDVFAQYPVGARSKALVISPDVAPHGIKASWPYLFKRSIKNTQINFGVRSLPTGLDCSLVLMSPKQFLR